MWEYQWTNDRLLLIRKNCSTKIKMETATLSYLDFVITIELPDPKEDNSIYILIHRLEGSYNKEEYNSYLTHFRFSAENSDPNKWLVEAIDAAIYNLISGGDICIYYNLPVQWGSDETTNEYSEGSLSVNSEADPDNIPF